MTHAADGKLNRVSFLLIAFVASCFADATVISSARPDFPLSIDKVELQVFSGEHDSTVLVLPVSVYTDFRDNIDTLFNYAQALSLKRPELSGKKAVYARLVFSELGTSALWVIFTNKDLKSGKLSTATDKYPFVVLLSKGFARKLKTFFQPASHK